MATVWLVFTACMLFLRTVQAGNDPNVTVPSGVVVYVPVTLTNSQSSAVSNGTQVKISMNWNTYSTYLDNPVDNYVFFNSAGTKLNSWLESGTNNTATAAVLWLKLDSGITAHGSYTVYLGFTAKGTSILGSAAATGVAPNLNAVYAGATYGSLDNGANVFAFYDNFAGASLNAKWTPWNTSQGTVSVNNGVTITHTAATSSTGAFGIFAGFAPTTTQQGAGIATETYFNVVNLASGYRIFDGYGMTGGGNAETNGYLAKFNANSNTRIAVSREAAGAETILKTNADTLTVGNNYQGNLVWQGNNLIAANLTDAVSTNATDTTYNLSSMTQVSLADGGSQNTAYTTYWVRIRQAPPVNTMPSATFGSLGGPATKLAFGVEPGTTTAGHAISPSVTVIVEDQFGNTVTSDSSSVTIGSGTTGFAGGSTLTVAAVNGVATFSAVDPTTAGTANTLTASDGALAGATSNPFTVTAASVNAGQSTVGASPASVTADGTTTSTVTVTLKDAYGNPVSGKTVTLAKNSGPGSPVIGAASGSSSASGVVTFTVKSTTARDGCVWGDGTRRIRLASRRRRGWCSRRGRRRSWCLTSSRRRRWRGVRSARR